MTTGVVLLLAGAMGWAIDPVAALPPGVTEVQLPGFGSGDRFGWAVAIRGDRAAVGAPGNDWAGTDAGAVFIYERDAVTGTWIFVADVRGLDTDWDDCFGASVALDGDLLAVGAPCKTDGPGMDGAAYVFRRDLLGFWREEARFVETGYWSFGNAVSVHGNLVAVGAFADGVHIYAHQALGIWAHEASLPDPAWWDTDLFGAGLQLDGLHLVVGASQGGPAGSSWGRGRAYVFHRAAPGAWVQVDSFEGSDTGNHDHFGGAVAMRGGIVVAGAELHDHGGRISSGAAYIRELGSGVGWTETAHFTRNPPTVNDHFGSSLAVDGDLVLVGARRQTGPLGYEEGAAHLFRKSGGVWKRAAEIVPTNSHSSAFFGTSVGLDGDRAIVGAPYQGGTGMAYIYDLSGLEAGTTNEIIIERAGPGASLTTQKPVGWTCTQTSNLVTRVEVSCLPPFGWNDLCARIQVTTESVGAGTASGRVSCAGGAFDASAGHSSGLATATTSTTHHRTASPAQPWPFDCVGEGLASFRSWKVTCKFN